MLFAATTINYMDRQVLALLKPTLMQSVANHGIGLTEESYGTVVAFFTLFYAIGQLGAGRFVDKVGTRIGYMVIMALWSLSAMGHALVNSVLQLGIARSFLGIGESGNFPAANKDERRVVSAERALVFIRHLQLRRQYRRDPGHASCADRSQQLWLALRLSDHRDLLGVVDRDVVLQISQAHRTSHTFRHRACVHQPGPRGEAGSIHAVGQIVWFPADLGLRDSQVPHRSYLVVLSLLAAGLLQRSNFI